MFFERLNFQEVKEQLSYKVTTVIPLFNCIVLNDKIKLNSGGQGGRIIAAMSCCLYFFVLFFCLFVCLFVCLFFPTWSADSFLVA